MKKPLQLKLWNTKWKAQRPRTLDTYCHNCIIMEFHKHVRPTTYLFPDLIIIIFNRKINVSDSVIIGDKMKQDLTKCLFHGFLSLMTRGHCMFSRPLKICQTRNISLTSWVFEYELCGVHSSIIDDARGVKLMTYATFLYINHSKKLAILDFVALVIL